MALEINPNRESSNSSKSILNQELQTHYDACLRKAEWMVKDKEVAKDMVQEAFLQAYLNVEKLRDSKALKGWLLGIVRNVCNNYFREKKQAWVDLDKFEIPQEVPAEPRGKNKVEKALRKLSEKERKVVESFYLKGKSIDDIALENNLSQSAVKLRLFRARKKMREETLKNKTISSQTHFRMTCYKMVA